MWSSTGLLEGFSNETSAFNCAISMQAQLHLNESGDDANPAWRRISLPVINRIFRSVANLKGLQESGEWHNTGIKVSEKILAQTKTDKYSLDEEANATAALAGEIANYVSDHKFGSLGAIKLENGIVQLNVA